MSSTILLTIQAIVALLGPVLLGWWLRQRFGSRWSSWGWGALAFVGSQLARTPLLVGLTVLGQRLGPDVDPNWAFWSNLLVLCITAGLFEESARYIVMSRFAKQVRNWREGVMFGAGHGGIEAMIYVGGAVINSIVLLSMGDTLVEQVRATSPEQVPLLLEQLEQLRTLQWWMPLISIWERVLAITFHIAASLLVMRAVQRGSFSGTAWPMLYHAILNAGALIAQRYGGIAATYIVLMVLVIPAVLIIRAMRREEQAMEPKAEAT